MSNSFRGTLESPKQDWRLNSTTPTLPQTPPSQSHLRPKRFTLGHRRNLSLDAARLIQTPEKQNEGRPASTCGFASPDGGVANTTDHSPSSVTLSGHRPRLRSRRFSIMFSSSPETPPESTRPSQRLQNSNPVRSGYDSSVSSHELREKATETRVMKSQQRGRKMKWFSQVKDWLSTREPSADALEAQRSKTTKRHGIDLKDSKAGSKLHIPIAKLPANVTTSTTGPTPEKALKKTLQERQMQQSFSSTTLGTTSLSSRDSYSPSVRDSRRITPWEG